MYKISMISVLVFIYFNLIFFIFQVGSPLSKFRTFPIIPGTASPHPPDVFQCPCPINLVEHWKQTLKSHPLCHSLLKTDLREDG